MESKIGHYEEIANNYDQFYEVFRPGYVDRFATFQRVFKAHVGPQGILTNCLDLGGGTGLMVPYIRQAFGIDDVIIGDFSKSMRSVAESKGIKTVFCDFNNPQSIVDIAKTGVKFDLVFNHWCLHHCHDLTAFYKAVSENILADGGYVFAVLEDDNKFPAPRRVSQARNQLYQRMLGEMEGKVGKLPSLRLLHKEHFNTGKPWSLPMDTYKRMVDAQFITAIGEATPDEIDSFMRDEIMRKDEVTIDNHDWIFIFAKQ